MNLFFRKSMIAITGLFLCLFLIVHLSANCILLLPEDIARELYNSYSTTLRENPLIKLVAYVLYLSIIIHVIYALLVTLRNKKAKPSKYALNHSGENSSWASQKPYVRNHFV
jgi:succinate dehydrogenase / fumarate reductase cytochrome b subunit